MINPIARLIFWLIIICLVAFCTNAVGQTLGKPAMGTFVTCSTKEEAVKALTILKKEGREKFEQAFKALDCQVGQGIGLLVGVVAVVKIEDKTYKVVRIDFDDATRYWMTSQDIKGEMET